MKEKRWFGRQPALWINSLATVLAVGVGFGVPGLTDGLAAAIVALAYAVAGVYVAWSVQPAAPGLFTGLIAASAALAAEFGFHVSQQQVSLIAAAAATIVTLWAWPNVTPAHDPVAGISQPTRLMGR